MKKILLIISIIFATVLISGCQGKTYEIALITDVGTINDKSFNQGSWEGVVQYADEFDVSHKYYQPSDRTDDDYLEAIELAINNGAKVVVTPGFYFEKVIYEVQDDYPDVTFILIDGVPNNLVFDEEGNVESGEERIEDNVYSILFAEEQSGFLAGYAAVKEGFTSLGFMGGNAVPAVVRFGYGFLQGAEYAANEMELDDGAITVKYKYLNSFKPSADIQTEAASWYTAGTEIIFVAAGGAGSSVMAAAESQTEKYVIGVDVDQKDESPTVITSAMKELKNSVYLCLKAYYEDDDTTISTAETTILDATNDGIGLPDDFSRFENFTSDDYNTIYTALKEDTDNIRTNIINDITLSYDQLGLVKVSVDYTNPET